MAAPLRKSSVFYSDLRAIVDYIAADKASSAYRFVDSVEETLELLRKMPEIGTKFPTSDDRFSNLRRITIRGFRNYQVLYDVRDDEVFVFRVVHGARDLPKLI